MTNEANSFTSFIILNIFIYKSKSTKIRKNQLNFSLLLYFFPTKPNQNIQYAIAIPSSHASKLDQLINKIGLVLPTHGLETLEPSESSENRKRRR